MLEQHERPQSMAEHAARDRRIAYADETVAGLVEHAAAVLAAGGDRADMFVQVALLVCETAVIGEPRADKRGMFVTSLLTSALLTAATARARSDEP